MSTEAYRNPKIWGPPAWVFLFTIALTSDYNSYKIFFENLSSVLPCGTCQSNYRRYLAANPIKRNTDIFEWLVGLYNQSAKVRRTKDEVLRYYQRLYGIQTRTPTRREIKIEEKQQRSAAQAGARSAAPLSQRHGLFVRRALGGGCCGKNRFRQT